jgi:glycosyltransferase involved in cell wall biosynthesis
MSNTAPENSKLKLRILMVAPTLPIVGGQTVQAARLISALAGEPDVTVDLQPINPKFLPGLQKIKYVRTLVTSLKYISDLLLKVPQYDIIHIFSASYSSFMLAPTPAVFVAKLFAKKTILNYRSGEMTDHLTRWRRTALPTIRLFDSIITPSGYLVDEFAKFGLKANSVFNFVDVDMFRFRTRVPLRPAFLSNRNFEAHYNVRCIIRAFAIIQDAIPDASLIVAGDGPERGAIHKLAAELALKNVEFIGKLQPEDMPAVYDKADVYLNSPSIDNMPNSIIEAFACGLPVVSTDAGGIPYIVENGKTGLLVGVDDHEALAREALRLFEDAALADRLIAAARDEVQKYTWQNVRDEWLRTYRELACGRGGSG